MSTAERIEAPPYSEYDAESDEIVYRMFLREHDCAWFPEEPCPACAERVARGLR